MRVSLIGAILTGGLAATGCSSWPSAAPVSSIDAHFRLQRIERASAGNSSASPSVRTYQKLSGQILGSDCRYFPSDSRYHLTISKTCGPYPATIKSMSRFLLEYDAPKLGRSVVFDENKVHYLDLPNDCEWL